MQFLFSIYQLLISRTLKSFYTVMIVLLLNTMSNKSLAFSWSKVGQAISKCFNNPCDCGSSGQRQETWGTTVNTFNNDANCPPYNRAAGRDDNTCLVAPGHPYPSNFTSFYITRCAEQAPDNSYFTPKIRVRNQNCNGLACWSVNTTLNWDGQCVLWASAYGLPTIRICARIAQAANPQNGTPADDGYTQGIHLDSKGEAVADPVILDYTGNPITTLSPPKLCAYNDPSAIDTLSAGGTIDGISFPDLMDINPLKQPLHKTTQEGIVTRLILLFLKLGASTADTLISMLEKVFGATSGSSSSLPNINIFKPIFELVGKIVQLYFSKLAEFIKEHGGLNAVVNASLGCVNIPLGPFPPPFCSSILPYIPVAVTQKICEVDTTGSSSDMIDSSSLSIDENADGGTSVVVAPNAVTTSGYVQSVDSAPCVISSADNNAINNSIRISFDNFIPLCANGENPSQTDKCIVIAGNSSNSSGSLVASSIHQLTQYQDMIERCPPSGANGFCLQINDSISTPCDGTSNTSCSGGFRIVYASNIGTTAIPSGYYMDDLVDCNSNGSSSSMSCQSVWGINSGQFVDVSLRFPEENDQNNLLISSTLNDTNNQMHRFSTAIVRQQITDPTNGFTQSPDQICVTEPNDSGYRVVGCVERVGAFETLVENCAPENIPYCVSTYWAPSFIIKMRSFATPINPNNIYSTADLLAPSSVNNSSNTNSTVNLAGFNFDSFVTDDDLLIKPFTDSHIINNDQSSRYGNYKNNANPTQDANSVYLNGIEYYQGSYVEGGKYACANFQTIYHCPINQQNCVLAKLVDSDNVDCNSFAQKLQTYPDLVMCYSGMQTSDQVDSIQGKNGQPAVGIYNVTNSNTTSHCYLTSSNQAICTPSILIADRMSPTPDASTGPLGVLSSDQYYSSNLMQNYDSSIAGLRDKSPFELGRCVEITQPTCQAITTPGPNDGNATWAEGTIGIQSIGTCIANSVQIDPNKPLLRYCLANVKNQTVAFENLDSGVGCVIPSVALSGAISSTFPAGYQLDINSNDSGGTIIIQCAADSCAALVANQSYNYTFNLNISPYNNLQQFKITSVNGSGSLNLSVNNNSVTATPGISGVVGVDISQYLQEGDNNIILQLQPDQSAAASSFSIEIDYLWK